MQIGLVLLCIAIHFVAGQIIEYLADKERGPWLTADRERRIRLSLLDLQTRCAVLDCGACVTVSVHQDWRLHGSTGDGLACTHGFVSHAVMLARTQVGLPFGRGLVCAASCTSWL